MDYTDTHLQRRKRDTNSLGKPAELFDKANNLINKIKGSTFSLKRLTELSDTSLANYSSKAKKEMKSIEKKKPEKTTFKDTDKYFKRKKGLEKVKSKLTETEDIGTE